MRVDRVNCISSVLYSPILRVELTKRRIAAMKIKSGQVKKTKYWPVDSVDFSAYAEFQAVRK